jgi:uncharacterized cupredoxin-like copper-binding protein
MFRLILIVASVLAVLVAAGCGGSEASTPSQASAPGQASAPSEASTPTSVEIDAADYAFVMPDRIEGGVVSMRFRNTGKELHEFAFVRIGEGHTVDDALAALEKSGDDLPWLTDKAGPPLLTPGAEITITRRLEPGTYAFLCYFPDTEGVPHVQLGMARQFTVVGDSGAELPKPDAVITAERKRYVVPNLRAGKQTIELRNASGGEREFILTTFNPGKTVTDADRWFGRIESSGHMPRTPAPLTGLGAIQSIPNGTSVYLTVNLEAGRTYRLADDEHGIEATFTPS